MKITIKFYEIKDSDYTGIRLYAPHSVYTNHEPESHQATWLNQTIESEVDESGLAALIQSLDLKLSHMRTVQVIVDDEGLNQDEEREYTEILCPCCGLLHLTDEWTPRHRMPYFSVIEWYEDKDGENELSFMKCNQCNETFLLEWDFKNNEL